MNTLKKRLHLCSFDAILNHIIRSFFSFMIRLRIQSSCLNKINVRRILSGWDATGKAHVKKENIYIFFFRFVYSNKSKGLSLSSSRNYNVIQYWLARCGVCFQGLYFKYAVKASHKHCNAHFFIIIFFLIQRGIILYLLEYFKTFNTDILFILCVCEWGLDGERKNRIIK